MGSHALWQGLLRLLDAAGRLDRRIVHLLVLAVSVVAVLVPAHLPVHPRPDTRSAFALGQAIQPGQGVFIWIDYGFGAQEELDPMLEAVVRQLMRRGAVIWLAARSVEGGQIADQAMAAATEQTRYASGYGRTWVNLGYRPAADIALRAATVNLPAAYNGVDEQGRALAAMPLAAGAPVALGPRDFRLAYVFDWGDGYLAMMTYVAQVTGLPMAVGAIAMEAPVIQPFVATGQIAAVISGIRGAAEYEALLGAPGRATTLDQGTVYVAVFVLLLLLAGNLSLLAAGALARAPARRRGR